MWRGLLAGCVTGVVALAATVAPSRAAEHAAPPSAVTAPSGVIAHAGRWMTEPDGKVIIVHGVNMPSKWAPQTYPAALAFGDDDATVLAGAGLNAVRLTVERYAVEPQPGHFDDAYIDHISATVAMLAAHGILSLIDFHQDEYGPVFDDNGFPGWMTMTDGVPNLTQVGFPFQYFANPALLRAFDHFWSNSIGPDGKPLQTDDAQLLAHVAHRMSSDPDVLGYEIINEPSPGSLWPLCFAPVIGCPAADSLLLQPYYSRVVPAIRAADPGHLIWEEPWQTFNQGVPTTLKMPADSRMGFAFHDYPICSAVTDALLPSRGQVCPDAVPNALSYIAKTNAALLETEWGNSSDITTVNSMMTRYDQGMIPWLFWSYSSFVDHTAAQGVLLPPTGSNLNAELLTALARPYPQVIAGTPTGWSFDATRKAFALTYTSRRADGHGAFGAGAETDVSTPSLVYPHGYTVTVTGASVVSVADAPTLRLVAGPGTAPITVHVAARP